MIPLLARENQELLARLAWTHVLLAFDFDGTLAPIVASRGQAHMRPLTSRLFTKLSHLYPCAVISGRAQRDVSSRLGKADVKYVVGNHGLEPGTHLKEFHAQMERAKPLLTEALTKVQGVDVEDKRYSLAVHYRRARNKRVARAAIAKVIDSLPHEMRVVPGKLVVNLVPLRAPNKGDALLDLRAREGAGIAMYIGDDVTDEDVFRIDQPGRLISVRVGTSEHSSARYCLRSQREIDSLLRRLCALREGQTRK